MNSEFFVLVPSEQSIEIFYLRRIGSSCLTLSALQLTGASHYKSTKYENAGSKSHIGYNQEYKTNHKINFAKYENTLFFGNPDEGSTTTNNKLHASVSDRTGQISQSLRLPMYTNGFSYCGPISYHSNKTYMRILLSIVFQSFIPSCILGNEILTSYSSFGLIQQNCVFIH